MSKLKGGAFMDKVQRMKQEQQYEKYVKQKTPTHNVWLNMLKAFLLGGAICFIGQVIFHYCEFRKFSEDDCSAWTSMILVLISVLLIGCKIFTIAGPVILYGIFTSWVLGLIYWIWGMVV